MKNLKLFILLSLTLLLCGASFASTQDSATDNEYSSFDSQQPKNINNQSWGNLKAAVQEQKFFATAGAAGDNFGISVSISGDRALVGANGRNSSKGAAYIFEYSASTWSQTAVLTATGNAGDNFGYAVSLVGDRALLGAYGDNSDQGAAYIFDLSGGNWIQTVKLQATLGSAGDQFGYSVSLLDGRAIIGANLDDNAKGAAFIFDLDVGSWTQTTKLVATSRVNNDQFGYSVSLSSDRAAIGAPEQDSQGGNAGAAYIFDLSGGSWSQTSQLLASNGNTLDYFGNAVSLLDDTVVIGAYNGDKNGSTLFTGAAYVFDLSVGSWSQTTKLLAPDAADVDRFGYSVALSGRRILVSEPRDDENSISASGSVFVYTLFNGNWIYQDQLIDATTAKANDNLGIAVSLFGDRALAGAFQDNGNGNGVDSGSAYTYTLDPLLYAVGGTVSGLAVGNTVELENNLTDTMSVSNGDFTFVTGLVEASTYAVTVKTSPTSPNQTCEITGGSNGDGSGDLIADDYTDIVVSCAFICETQNNGDWSQASTWTNCNNTIPQDNDAVIIKTNHTVTLDQDTSAISALNVEAGGDFNVAAPGFALKANTAGADIDLSNASIELEGFLTIFSRSHNLLLGDVDGSFALRLYSQLEIRLIGTIGGNTALSSFQTNSASTTIFTNINGSASVATVVVDGDRIFDGPVLLAEYTNIQGNGGVITFNSTLDSETSTDEALAITFASNVDISFNGKVGNINRLERLQIINSNSSTSFINTSKILTNRQQRWGTDIVIDSPTNQLLMNVGINGSIKIGSSGANHTVRSLVANTESLTIETDSVVSIFSTIGDNNQALDDLTIESASTMLLYNDITADGDQSFIGPIALAAAAQLTGRVIDFRETVDNGGFDLTLSPSSTIFNLGVFSGSGDIIKEGTGSFAVQSSSTVTGDIFINQGSIINSTGTENAFANASGFYLGDGTSSKLGISTTDIFTLGNGQTLAGTGICDCNLSAQSGAIVSPGFSPGLLEVESSVALNTGSILTIELNGNTIGTGYDQLLVLNGGEFNLDADNMGGATLNPNIGNGFVPNIGDTFTIVGLTSSSMISGTFNGLAESSIFNVDGTLFSISYLSDSVMLTTTGQVCGTLQSGNWSDPNTWENCNNGIPQDGYSVIINDTHIVTLDQDTALLDGITVVAGGDLNVSGNYSLMADASGADFDLQNASIDLLGDLTIDAQAHKILLGAVDGAFGLTLNSSNETRLLRAIGDDTPLTSITTDAAGSTIFDDTNTVGVNTANLTVTGPRVFNDPILLANNITINGIGGNILFNDTINSESTNKVLSIFDVTGDNITFVGDIGGVNELRKLTIFKSNNSVINLYLSSVKTTEHQFYKLDVFLNSPTDTVTMESTNNKSIILGSGLRLNYLRSEPTIPDSLIISTGGIVELRSLIGTNNQQLANLTVNLSSSIELETSTVIVDDSITFTAPIIMDRNSVLSASVIDMQNDVDNAGFDLTFNTTDTNDLTNITGVLSGAGDFIKEGLGDMAFDSINTFSGDLLLNQGVINNTNNSNAAFANVGIFSLAQGTEANIGGFGSLVFDLANNQSMIGQGTCNCFVEVKNGAIVSPGFSPGQLSITRLDMNTGSTLSIELEGTVAGTEYDQVKSLSNINIDADNAGGANLELSVTNGFVPVVGDTFTIIEVDTSTLGAGTFNGLAEGDLISANGYIFSISYIGGVDNNDVVLTVVSSIIYVDADAAPAGDGQSWATAFDNLQDALSVAVSGMEIWVAEGVYYPDVGTGQNPQDQTSAFSLIEGVNVYGGFAGIETELIQRDPTTNITILSGDIDGDDINTDANTIAETVADIQGSNAYHVLNGQNVTVLTVIDGLTVTAGSATVASPIDGNGGGMLCNDTDGPSINAMVFIGNAAFGLGGASFGCDSNVSNSQYLSNESSNGGAIFSKSARFENVQFKGNSSTSQSGGALAVFGSLYLENVLFLGNNSADAGGAVFVGSTGSGESLVLINVTITGNQSVSAGAGLKVASSGTLDINNSIIWNNQYGSINGTASASIDSNLPVNKSYSLIQGFGTTGIGNLDEDPLFINDSDPSTAPTILGNAHLDVASPAIASGDNSVVTSLTDLDGNPRIPNTIVDMGAYAFNSYGVSVNVSGLDAGTLVLQNNGGDDLIFSNISSDDFATDVANTASYLVTVLTQPSSPNQDCVISNGSGTINGVGVTVSVVCTIIQYNVGVDVTGLASGNILELENNGEDLTVNTNGQFNFPLNLDDGSAYDVLVASQPTTPNQMCSVVSGSGNLAGADVLLTVACTTDEYFIGGIASGLVNGNSVTLSLGAEELNVNSNAAFVFLNPLTDETSYSVSVANHPTQPNQTCGLVNPTGTIAGDDISDIEVNCTINQYLIGGFVTGLHSGNNLVLQNNGADDLIIVNSGDFDFSTAIDDLQGYNVSIFNQASNPIQPCVISNNNGNVAGSAITTVAIVCEFGDDLIFRDGFE